MQTDPSPHPSPLRYLFSELGPPRRGARTVPVRSAWAGRGALEKGDVFGQDNPLRTGTVRGPMQRGVPTGLNRYPLRGERVPVGRVRGILHVPKFLRAYVVPALFACLVLLEGCAVGPDSLRPAATTIPPAYAGATNGWKVAEPQAQIPKGNWWEIFGDTELSDLESPASAANQHGRRPGPDRTEDDSGTVARSGAPARAI